MSPNRGLTLRLVSLALQELIRAALILAKGIGFDAFTALDVGGISSALTGPECKFAMGTGILRYYLFNWQGLAMKEKDIGFVAL